MAEGCWFRRGSPEPNVNIPIPPAILALTSNRPAAKEGMLLVLPCVELRDRLLFGDTPGRAGLFDESEFELRSGDGFDIWSLVIFLAGIRSSGAPGELFQLNASKSKDSLTSF